MQAQEREQLVHFLHQLTQAPSVQKDTEADALIREACARQSDAPYLLVQRALLVEQALQQAQAQIGRLQGELDQARSAAHPGGFLDGNAWGNPAPRPASSVAPAAPAYQAAQATPAPAASWGSGWLGNVATTAAGVVAGSFLFQGIEHLLGSHHGGSSWFGGNDDLSRAQGETTVVNNYFDSTSGAGSDFDAAALGDGLSADSGTDDTPDWI
ncbi:MAG TPA: DUF2076 family protein [Rhodocyclaceae bacterium]|nr:DUF2076 family protein [Rhodocyclaceae bacterium]